MRRCLLKDIWDHGAHYVWCLCRPPIDASVWSGAAEWNRVVFNDESRLTSVVMTIVYACGDLNPTSALQRHTAPTAGVMVWGVIAYDTGSPLVLIRGTMTA
ncbi:hypothetical protein TNCV_4438201 [Trichonephila clavipes]|nr:hypothetical protein TNCV_4438201 [Trichonephila clavipes]